jgi:hypothetical protein
MSSDDADETGKGNVESEQDDAQPASVTYSSRRLRDFRPKQRRSSG